MLGSIHVYQESIAKIPKRILSKIRKSCFQFLWKKGGRWYYSREMVMFSNTKGDGWLEDHKYFLVQQGFSSQEPLETYPY
jgi:hypothetical protein